MGIVRKRTYTHPFDLLLVTEKMFFGVGVLGNIANTHPWMQIIDLIQGKKA